MALCTGKTKSGAPCKMQAGADGKCVNHRDEKPAAPATSTPPESERALMPGERPGEPKKKRRTSTRSTTSTTSTTSTESGVVGQVVAGVVAGALIIAGIAWAVLSPAKPAAAAAETKLRAVS